MKEEKEERQKGSDPRAQDHYMSTQSCKRLCVVPTHTGLNFATFVVVFVVHLFTCAYIVWVISPPCLNFAT
jgi:hypothetical protein